MSNASLKPSHKSYMEEEWRHFRPRLSLLSQPWEDNMSQEEKLLCSVPLGIWDWASDTVLAGEEEQLADRQSLVMIHAFTGDSWDTSSWVSSWLTPAKSPLDEEPGTIHIVVVLRCALPYLVLSWDTHRETPETFKPLRTSGVISHCWHMNRAT